MTPVVLSDGATDAYIATLDDETAIVGCDVHVPVEQSPWGNDIDAIAFSMEVDE